MPSPTVRAGLRRTFLATAVLLGVTGLAACGSSGSATPASAGNVTVPAVIGPPPTNAPTGGPTLPAGTAAVSSLPTKLGEILVDGSTGRTLYAYVPPAGRSADPACTGTCARLWTPYTGSHIGVASTLTYRPGEFKLVARPGGGPKQLTVDGHLLFEYRPDVLAGQTKGQALGGTWFAVSPDGSLITRSASSGG